MGQDTNIEIFWISGSPYSWRVLLALAIKEMPYESRLLSAANNEHRSPEFLAINPKGKLPALRHGKLTMGESIAIIRYIDRCNPKPPLFGRDAMEEAQINQLIDEIENYLIPNSHSITRAAFGGIVAGKEELLNEQAKRAHKEFAGLEERVGTWLVGDAISAADIVLYPVIAGLLRAAGKPVADSLDLRLLPFAGTYPKLADWCNRIEALPGFDTTYPPHWRDG